MVKLVAPKISVVMPCRNEHESIEFSLDSILSQTQIEGGFEILVADGMSDDGTREILNRISSKNPHVRIIDNPGKIVSTGLNAAVHASRGDVIIRMDCHTEYAPDYIAQCVKVLTETNAANVGGPARTAANNYMGKANSLAYHSLFSVGGARFHNPDYEGYADTVPYGCWRKSTLEKIGLFDEELVRNQDDELNLRIIRSGGNIWQSPRIKSWYYPRSSLLELFKQYMQYGYWKVRVIQKHKLPAAVRHLIPGGFLAMLMVLAVLTPFVTNAGRLLSALVILYAISSLAASAITCRKPENRKYFPVMPFVFGAYHFGYGYGFLRGIIDFVILHKGGRKNFSKITRN